MSEVSNGWGFGLLFGLNVALLLFSFAAWSRNRNK